MTFAQRLSEHIRRAGSPICVGLDPVLESIPEAVRSAHADPVGAIRAFTLGVLDAVQGVAPVVKFQSACYERYGHRGVEALEEGLAACESRGLLALLDAKRGDIGISARHYAAAARAARADAITLSPYLGPDTLTPYLDAGLGIFVLVRTSNPDSDAIQSERLASGATIAGHVASLVRGLGAARLGPSGLSDVGAVVGATKSADAMELRRLMPDTWFLIPGFGAQGGSAKDIVPMLRPGSSPETSGVLVTASRSIIYPAQSDRPPSDRSGGDWLAAIRAAARAFHAEIAAVVRAG
jgi:orotidine-5'-phosphate decarboxylase